MTCCASTAGEPLYLFLIRDAQPFGLPNLLKRTAVSLSTSEARRGSCLGEDPHGRVLQAPRKATFGVHPQVVPHISHPLSTFNSLLVPLPIILRGFLP